MVEPGLESMICALLFAVLGFLILSSLETNFMAFYLQHRDKLMLTNILLVLATFTAGMYYVFFYTWMWNQNNN